MHLPFAHRRYPVRYAAALSFFAVSVWSSTAALQIEGHFEMLNVFGGGPPHVERTLKYRVEFDAPRGAWLIEDLDHPPRCAFTYRGDVLARQVFIGLEKTQFDASSLQDGYPIELDSDLRLVWFVYCARDFLRQHEAKPVILPHGEPRENLVSDSCVLKSDWNRESDLCPEKATFILDHDLLKAALTNLTLEPPGNFLNEREKVFHLVSKSATNGEVAAQFRVSAWSKTQAQAIPANWTLTVLSHGRPMWLYQGVTDIAVGIERMAPLPLPPIAEIRDKRVRSTERGVNLVSYIITNGQLPTVGAPGLQNLVAKAANPDLKLMPPDLRLPRAIFLGIIGILFAAPVLVWLFGRTNRSAGKNPEANTGA